MLEVIVWIGVILIAGIIFFFFKLIVANRKIKHQGYTIVTQLADMRRMISELEEWEKCVGFLIEEKTDEFLEALEAKHRRAEAENRFWETRRLNMIKEKYLEKIKNSAYENQEVFGEAAEK